MTRVVLDNLTAGQVERFLYAYREICDLYEEIAGGVHGAYSFREYIVAAEGRNMCSRRLNELIAKSHGDGVQD